jgi:ParB family chromosome partitioning protein
MSMKRRGLGRGLDALLGDSERNATPSDEAYRELPVHQIERGKYQPRREIRQEALEELAASIRAQGLMQPVVVRMLGQDRYELIAGERRWRAAQLAGLTAIPAMVRDVPDESALALALIENVQRENLNPVEEAFALKRLQDEFGLTQQEAADAVGKSRVTVTNLLRLLNLEPEVRELLERGALEMGHARALLGVTARLQVDLGRQVVDRSLSVRETEALVRRATLELAPKPQGERPKDPDTRRLEGDLSARLGAPVSIDHGAKGAGRVVIRYSSLDELDGILRHLR